MDPSYRKCCTLGQRGCDCYILRYSSSSNEIDEITRLSLLTFLDMREDDPMHRVQEVTDKEMRYESMTDNFFGRLTVEFGDDKSVADKIPLTQPKVCLRRSANNQEWIS